MMTWKGLGHWCLSLLPGRTLPCPSAGSVPQGAEWDITIDNLGTNEVMLSGPYRHYFLRHYPFLVLTFIDPNDFDFADLRRNITLSRQACAV
jgi:hypothetical protein